MIIVKICGLRDTEHALIAAESGADLLGFNFVEGVRRQLTEAAAFDVISAYRDRHGVGGPGLVGLFANQPLEFVNRVVRQCGMDYAQLCGDEPLEYWGDVDATVIRQIRVRDDIERQEALAKVLTAVGEAVSGGHIVLLDKHQAGALGGTGKSFDWTIAEQVARDYDILLAGGLDPENVSDAISIARPWGVDVSSGVETDGAKDASKIRAFVEAAKTADLG
ncbi:MAG: phosphoribosylanthranilate isomerase [SAR202 cluster bacterium]|jgi:phosphoribosylanthranilate isomerase|nr:phosphoribosylanthranilate isomerase [SAR202 cluster bacterium]HAL47436.1 N-(5'-phosphoribosyl)anthranilate isomerase [Dehalococcoidia bacterium]MDP6662959.1 phosphoribosylanthranilate isomerase [SAR202 cluster bacterium]MDP6798861.1 phosphoribosylanthranilate isomerase [SAR202 cluster bacterium]MQG59085.1 phosphoribosylanthranilate isomerase [SAR202 cluster bacterium]|tara:strand:- start:8824 stop:9486 length:663 start_codon:yes stop_codon:yes gene_type:complete